MSDYDPDLVMRVLAVLPYSTIPETADAVDVLDMLAAEGRLCEPEEVHRFGRCADQAQRAAFVAGASWAVPRMRELVGHAEAEALRRWPA